MKEETIKAQWVFSIKRGLVCSNCIAPIIRSQSIGPYPNKCLECGVAIIDDREEPTYESITLAGLTERARKILDTAIKI